MHRVTLHRRRGVALALAIGSALAFGAAAGAQTNAVPGQASAQLPEFEVATVKPVDPGAAHLMGVHVYPGGRLVINVASLKGLIVDAFHLAGWDLAGGEPWMDSVEYHIEAKPPAIWQARLPDAQYSWFGIANEHVREMLQSLLIDRFDLRFHRETKAGTVYVLEKSGKPLQLRPIKGVAPAEADTAQEPALSGNISRVEGRGWFLFYSSMPQLASRLSGHLRAPVLNHTDLDGFYDFESKVKQTAEDFKDDGTGSLLSGVQEMGLRLVKTQGPVETFVIDHAEKPSPN